MQQTNAYQYDHDLYRYGFNGMERDDEVKGFHLEYMTTY